MGDYEIDLLEKQTKLLERAVNLLETIKMATWMTHGVTDDILEFLESHVLEGDPE